MNVYEYLLSYNIKPSVQRIAIMDYLLKEHKVGVDGWTVEQNLMHRKKYAPDILGEIKDAAPHGLDRSG